ncbi:MAG: NAD(P)-dependent oxidoreductase [Bacillota bacterium]
MEKKKIHINLPAPFFEHEQLVPKFAKLAEKYEVKKTSYNTHEEIQPDLAWPDAFIMWSWPKFRDEEFAMAKNLKFQGQINTTRTTAEAALKAGVPMSEARHCWSPAVSEMALTLTLAGLRKTSQFHMEMRQGVEPWVEAFPTDIDSQERRLAGRKVGIVGFGRIGQGIADLMAPFKVELKAYDPYLPDAVASSFGATLTSVEDICANCEIIILCAANTDDAEKVVNASHINSMRSDAVLVNVGRSMLIDMDALLKRLEKGELIAMLDVFDTEPLELDSPFRKLKNAYLTPHRAGGIMESITFALDVLILDMEAAFEGKELKYQVREAALQCFGES